MDYGVGDDWRRASSPQSGGSSKVSLRPAIPYHSMAGLKAARGLATRRLRAAAQGEINLLITTILNSLWAANPRSWPPTEQRVRA
jgi:hypothetical protein